MPVVHHKPTLGRKLKKKKKVLHFARLRLLENMGIIWASKILVTCLSEQLRNNTYKQTTLKWCSHVPQFHICETAPSFCSHSPTEVGTCSHRVPQRLFKDTRSVAIWAINCRLDNVHHSTYYTEDQAWMHTHTSIQKVYYTERRESTAPFSRVRHWSLHHQTHHSSPIL